MAYRCGERLTVGSFSLFVDVLLLGGVSLTGVSHCFGGVLLLGDFSLSGVSHFQEVLTVLLLGVLHIREVSVSGAKSLASIMTSFDQFSVHELTRFSFDH